MKTRIAVYAAALLAFACGPANPADDAGPQDADAPIDAPEPAACTMNSDCPTSASCEVSRCAPASPSADARGCICTTVDCTMPDVDEDGHDSIVCGGDDCDDADPNRYPGNTEVCDALDHDEDCDVATPGFLDGDGDSYSDDRCCNVAADGTRNCGRDCDDGRPEVSPVGADDDCDTIDDDCDGAFDEDGGPQDFYPDTDGDGFGSGTPVQMCAREVEDFSTANGDCDETDVMVNPGATELCNGVDDDCNGRLDGPGEDMDGDGAASTSCGGSDCYDNDVMYVCETNGWRIASVSATDIDVADIDLDGDLDIAIAQGNSGLDLLLNPDSFDPLRAPWPSANPGEDESGYYQTVTIAQINDSRGFPIEGEMVVGQLTTGVDGLRYYTDTSELGWRGFDIAPFFSQSIAVGRLDSGTELDIAAASSSGSVRTYLGPDWTETILVPNGSAGFRDDPRRVELDDVDGDGNTDVVVGFDLWNPSGGSLTAGDSGRVDVFWGDGAGAFVRAQVHSGMDVRGIAVGDLDMDGDVDLAAVGARGEVTWLEQTAARTFTSHALVAGTGLADLWEAGAEIADLDGDGRGELLAGGRNGTVRVWTDVVAETRGPSFVTGSRTVWRIFARDVDGDSDPDVVLLAGDISGGDQIWWAENRGGQIAPVD